MKMFIVTFDQFNASLLNYLIISDSKHFHVLHEKNQSINKYIFIYDFVCVYIYIYIVLTKD